MWIFEEPVLKLFHHLIIRKPAVQTKGGQVSEAGSSPEDLHQDLAERPSIRSNRLLLSRLVEELCASLKALSKIYHLKATNRST